MNLDQELLLLGKRVKYLRRLKDLTQVQLAESTELSVNYISQIETGIACPALKTLFALAKSLNVELKDLFDYQQLPNSKETVQNDNI
jgi:transcriptional regulator with XRE-family HTH domain